MAVKPNPASKPEPCRLTMLELPMAEKLPASPVTLELDSSTSNDRPKASGTPTSRFSMDAEDEAALSPALRLIYR